jgi:hypothetical protein
VAKLTETFVQIPEALLPGGARDSQRFVAIPEWLLAFTGQPRRFLLYSHLWLQADWRAKTARPGRLRLARLCGCSLRTVDRAIAELKELGVLDSRRRCRRTAVYRLTLTPSWLKTLRARYARRGVPDTRVPQVAVRNRFREKRLSPTASTEGRAPPLLLEPRDRGTPGIPPVSPLAGMMPTSTPAQASAFAHTYAQRLQGADERTPRVLASYRRRGLSEAEFATALEALARADKLRQRRTSQVRYFVGVLNELLRRKRNRGAITGWRWVRGSHSGTYVRDPRGRDRPPWL